MKTTQQVIEEGDAWEIESHIKKCAEFNATVEILQDQIRRLEGQKKEKVKRFIEDYGKYTPGQKLSITFPNGIAEEILIMDVKFEYVTTHNWYEIVYIYRRMYKNGNPKPFDFKLLHSTAVKSIIDEI